MSKKMRWIAGVIYGLISVYEMLVLREIFIGATIIDIPIAWLFQILLMFGCGIMSVWLLAGTSPLNQKHRRIVTVSTAFVVIFQLITYSTQVMMIEYAISVFFPSIALAGNTIYQLIGMLIRMLLLVLGAFFVQSASEDLDAATSIEEAANQELEALGHSLDELEEKAVAQVKEALSDSKEDKEEKEEK